VSPAQEAFVQEWTAGLEKLRGMQQRLTVLHTQNGRRWVPVTTPVAVEVDQALGFYYEQHVAHRGELAVQAVNELHQQNFNDPGAAVDEMLREWMTEESPDWIREVIFESPDMERLLQRERLEQFTLDDWKYICGHCFAILTTARQVSNAALGKPQGTTATLPQRAEWYAEHTCSNRTAGGHTLTEMLQYLIWDERVPAAQRVWNVVYEREWKLDYFGIGCAGELLGKARPNEYPPRNNRVSRVLYALGFDVTRYGD
jgi:hypothetical protein